MTHLNTRSLPCQQARFTFLVLSAFALLFAVLSAQSKPPSSPGTKANPAAPRVATIQGIIQSGRLDDLRWTNFSDVRVPAETFYRSANFKPAWVEGDKPDQRAREMIDILLHADQEGLNSEDYDGPKWAQRLALLDGTHTPADVARFDAALTINTMRYASAIRIGRINPKHFKFGLDIEHKRLDLPQFVSDVATRSPDIKGEFVEVEPPFAGYKRLRQALLKYEDLASKDDGEKLPMPANPVMNTVYVGGEYDGIPRLTRLLKLVGDLPEDAVVPAASKLFQGPLVDAVKRFQKRHGLRASGNLSQETVEAMNVPLSARVEQIRLTLERYRWLRYTFSQPPIVVNLPEYRLYAFERGGGIGLTMNVNVGDAYDFQTPVFESLIRYLVFRPYWNVPPRILRDEVVTDIEEDRNYIKDNDMEVTTPAGQIVATGTISDSVLGQLRAGKLTVRQKPGPENALGLLKVIFPNEHHVYLHDTPESVDMFSESQRALSHGCIHLQHPAELAAWLLRDKSGWNPERVEQAMHEGRDNFTVNLTVPVPILIVYGTAIVEENGDVLFYRDIYGHDESLETALAKGYPYPQ